MKIVFTFVSEAIFFSALMDFSLNIFLKTFCSIKVVLMS